MPLKKLNLCSYRLRGSNQSVQHFHCDFDDELTSTDLFPIRSG